MSPPCLESVMEISKQYFMLTPACEDVGQASIICASSWPLGLQGVVPALRWLTALLINLCSDVGAAVLKQAVELHCLRAQSQCHC